MNKQDKKYLTYFSLFFGIAAIAIIGSLIVIDDTNEYHRIDAVTIVNARVLNVSEGSGHGICYIDFDDGQKIVISKGTCNFKYDPTDLIYFLTASDFVEKNAGNDTIRITRSNLSIKNTQTSYSY